MHPLQIGGLKINCPIMLAPMSNVTDFPFRQIAIKTGAEITFSEMVADFAMTRHAKKTIDRAKHENNSKTIVQIVGSDSKLMSETAKMIEDMGAQAIDINFGCPCKKINGNLAGAALMKDESLAHKIISNVTNAVKIPVTIKMRMGWDSQNLNAPNIAKIAEDSGVKMITIHGRTRAQMYTGNANWEFIKQIKQTVNIPIIVNGDIKDINDINKACEQSGADGVMIGRGAYGKPWLIGKLIKQQTTENNQIEPFEKNPVGIILEHYEAILSYYGIKRGLQIARKHIGWYSSGIENSSSFRYKINHCDDHKLVIQMIKSLFKN